MEVKNTLPNRVEVYKQTSEKTCGYDSKWVILNYMARQQKVVSVKLYPKEIEALEVVAKLAGWDGKSTALREFMKIWIEAAVVAIDSKSATKGTWQMVKSVQRIQHQMRQIEKKAEQSAKENMLHEHDLQVLKEALAI